MLKREVLENLCYYDDRNPNNNLDCYDIDEMVSLNEEIEKKGYCSCDNCFYNRTPLAEGLLKFIN